MMTVVDRQRLPGEVSKSIVSAQRRPWSLSSSAKMIMMGTQSQACTAPQSALRRPVLLGYALQQPVLHRLEPPCD